MAGLALINTHPDYMKFNGGRLKVDEYPAELYLQFLDYVKDRYGEEYCHLLPRELAAYARQALYSEGKTDRDEN